MLSETVRASDGALWFIQAFVGNIAGMTADAYGRKWVAGGPLIRGTVDRPA